MRFQDSSYTVFSCFRSKLWSGMRVSGIPNGVYGTADWLGLLHWDPRDPHPEGQMGFHLSGTWDSLGSHAWWDPNNAWDPSRDLSIALAWNRSVSQCYVCTLTGMLSQSGIPVVRKRQFIFHRGWWHVGGWDAKALGDEMLGDSRQQPGLMG